MRSWFAFPDPVNHLAARLVAGGVVLLCAATVLLDQPLLIALIAYGFVARVLAGPRWSPLALLVTRGLLPLLGWPVRPVPGPPKRFAQGLGALLACPALVLVLAGHQEAAYALLGVLAGVAALEALLGLCLGCRLFAWLGRRGWLGRTVCERCVDL